MLSGAGEHLKCKLQSFLLFYVYLNIFFNIKLFERETFGETVVSYTHTEILAGLIVKVKLNFYAMDISGRYMCGDNIIAYLFISF